MPPATEPEFDPIGIFKALDRARVTYIVIGGLARVLQGTDELTNGVDVVPAMREQNLRRLDVALGELNARRRDGKKTLAVGDVDVLDLETDLGELKIVPEPAGTAATTTCGGRRRGSTSAPGCAWLSHLSATSRA